MSRNWKRGRKRSAAVKPPESAALVSQEAGLPAEGGGPVSRPAWAPGDVDLFKVPEPVRRAVAEIVEPAYRKLVDEVEDRITPNPYPSRSSYQNRAHSPSAKTRQGGGVNCPPLERA